MKQQQNHIIQISQKNKTNGTISVGQMFSWHIIALVHPKSSFSSACKQ